jgi:hypothetical protein
MTANPEELSRDGDVARLMDALGVKAKAVPRFPRRRR